jgi:dephospho-CoA kinase
MIIGLTGKRGCGKDTIAKRLGEKYKFVSLDFTKDVLAPLLVNQGKAVTRENLIETAMAGRRKSHNGVWAEKLSIIIKRNSGKDFVISGIRFREEVEVFNNNFLDAFKLVAVVCEDRNRYGRVRKRGTKGEAGLTFKEFMEVEEKDTERVISGTMEVADFAMDNNGTLDDLHGEIDKLVKILKR